ncbi:MAG TPA: type I restriction enzyme HsdR N-terminal domain-containing protein [Coleofasciculaceae cyanobacterium]
MEVEQSKLAGADLRHADIVALGSDGQMVLLVEAKATKLKTRGAKCTVISQIKSYLQAANTDIPFIMIVDLENIEIFQENSDNLPAEPIASLKTAEVLGHYDAEFNERRIFEPYLTALVEAWLRDLAYHWKSQKPPAAEQLAAIGLLQQLEGGTTQSEVALGGGTLR